MHGMARILDGWRQGLTVAALCAALGGTCSAVMLEAEKQRLLVEAGDHAHRLAEAMARRLDGSLSRWANDVRLLARFETFEREPADPRAARRMLEDVQLRSPTFAWIGFAGLDGRVIAATGGMLEGVDISSRPWFTPGLAGLHLGDLHPAVLLARMLPESRGNERFLDAAAPVRSPDGRVLGVVAGHVNWRWAEALRDEVTALAPRRPAPLLWVLGADGTVLLGPDGAGVAPTTLPAGEGVNWMEASPPGQPASVLGFARADGLPGQSSFGWTVVAQGDRSAALAGLRTFGASLALVTVAVSLLGGWLAGRIAGRTRSVLRGVLGSGRGNELALRLEELRDQAWRDPLTGLLNRAGFDAWLRMRPELATGCALVACDLDGFRMLNERQGQAAGDALLRRVGTWLQQNLRTDDAAVRLGGDTFLLCLPGGPDRAYYAAREVAARLNLALRDGLATPSGDGVLSCSMGITLVPQHSPDIQGAIRKADAALREAKRNRPEGLPDDVAGVSVAVTGTEAALAAE